MSVPRVKLFSLLEHYLTWHYGQAYRDIYHVWMNFVWFCFHFFSISDLLASLFQPWKRMGEEYPTGFDIGRILSTFIINIMMRIVGAFVRLIVIAIGLGFASGVFFLGLSILILWTIMPVCFVALVVMGLNLIIYG